MKTEVRIGQLWRDNDTRMNGRTLLVVRLEERNIYSRGMTRTAWLATCRVGAGPTLETRIRVDRLQTSAFTLLRDENGKRVAQQEGQ